MSVKRPMHAQRFVSILWIKFLFLDAEEYYVYETEQAEAIFAAKEEERNDIRVWIYVQKEPIAADASHPIPQSYVDAIMHGCLTISEDFARSFIDTTQGWGTNADVEPKFVDDRDLPIFIRADPELSADNAETIDGLLKDRRPDAMHNRIEYNAEGHLGALTKALKEGLGHPRAIQQAELRVEAIRNCESAPRRPSKE